MKNKNIIVGLWIFFYWQQGFAQDFSYKLQLRHQIDLRWSEQIRYKNSIECGDHSDKNRDLGSENLVFDKQFNQTDNIKYTIAANRITTKIGEIRMGVGNQKSTSNKISIRSTKDKLSLLELSEDVTTYTMSLKDGLSFRGGVETDGSGCKRVSAYWNAARHLITGQAAFKYKMPPNQWLVGITLQDVRGSATIGKNWIGDLHQKPIEYNKRLYVWAEPGTEIMIPVDIQVASSGGDLAAFNISISHLKSTDPTNDLNQLKKIIESNGFAKLENSPLAFISLASALIGQKDELRKISQSMGLKEFRAISEWLFKVANSDLSSVPYELDVKTSAAALGYELAVVLLDEMKVFCKDTEVQLKLTNKKVTVPGFYAAFFWLNRDVKRLESMLFPEIRALLEELIRWENNDNTYASIASDEKTYKKLIDAYVQMRTYSTIGNDIFGGISRSINGLVKEFGGIASGSLSTDEIHVYLNNLKAQQNAVNKNLHKEISKFAKNNSNPVNSSEVLAELNAFEDSIKELTDEVLTRIKIVDINQEGGGVVDSMLSQLAHQVNIFDQPLNSQYMEKIRSPMSKVNNITNLKSTYSQCIGGVDL